jgi:uncharacterized protein (DUF488 family)
MKAKQNGGQIEPVIWTVGHSNRSLQELLALLQSVDIKTIVDCRTKPYSRWRQFNHSELAASLLRADISYEWHGNQIGGLGNNVDFDKTLDELAERASSERITLLCSEGLPKDCHRGTILTPELEKRGVTVKHLLYDTQPSRHSMQARLEL